MKVDIKKGLQTGRLRVLTKKETLKYLFASNEHQMPGDFLRAVVSNDLKEAFARADEQNTEAMFYNEAPSASWGSYNKFIRWCSNKMRRGIGEPGVFGLGGGDD